MVGHERLALRHLWRSTGVGRIMFRSDGAFSAVQACCALRLSRLISVARFKATCLRVTCSSRNIDLLFGVSLPLNRIRFGATPSARHDKRCWTAKLNEHFTRKSCFEVQGTKDEAIPFSLQDGWDLENVVPQSKFLSQKRTLTTFQSNASKFRLRTDC